MPRALFALMSKILVAQDRVALRAHRLEDKNLSFSFWRLCIVFVNPYVRFRCRDMVLPKCSVGGGKRYLIGG